MAHWAHDRDEPSMIQSEQKERLVVFPSKACAYAGSTASVGES